MDVSLANMPVIQDFLIPGAMQVVALLRKLNLTPAFLASFI
jgi:hypothetical protein